MSDNIWNPWHGCKKYSEGCVNCYVYRRDSSIGKDASQVTKTQHFDYAVKRHRDKSYVIPSGTTVYLCMTSDFFIDEADEWRNDIWRMVKERSDLRFMIITKRIVRFMQCIPDDWGDGYDNVAICCTIENQHQCDIRFPVFAQLPIKHKYIACEPLLTPIDMRKYLNKDICQLLVGGESGSRARNCDYSWILDLRQQAIEFGIPFYFKQTGAHFIRDGKLYNVPRRLQHQQARKACINTTGAYHGN